MDITEEEFEKAAARTEQARKTGYALTARYDRRRKRVIVQLNTGIERPAKKRIPQGAFRTARKQIRAEPEKAPEIEAALYAASRKERDGQRAAHKARTAEIIEFRKAGEWPPPSQRARLAAERRRAEIRADTAEASVATLTAEKRQAEGRVRELEAAAKADAKAEKKAGPGLPAAWTLPPDVLLKAGEAVAKAAEKRWERNDSASTSRPLHGIADSPVLTCISSDLI